MAIISVQGALFCRRIRGPEDVGDELCNLLGNMDQEVLLSVSLAPDFQILGLDVIALGSSWRACAEPRDMFSPVLRRNGTALLIAHNHPSGSTAPSQADADFTTMLIATGQMIGVDIVDHLIITRSSWRSLRESTNLWDRETIERR